MQILYAVCAPKELPVLFIHVHVVIKLIYFWFKMKKFDFELSLYCIHYCGLKQLLKKSNSLTYLNHNIHNTEVHLPGKK